MANILIIDDNSDLALFLEKVVRHLNYFAATENTLSDGIEAAQSGKYDVVFLDVKLPDGDGKSALPKILDCPNYPEVIVMTGYGNVEDAELAIKKGALDYLIKPFNVDTISNVVRNAIQYRKEKKSKSINTFERFDIIGKSALLKDVIEQSAIASTTSVNVHIRGETGTGKELFARTIHENSTRAEKIFVTVDCASIPESLIESILFGYVKGAFTGAEKIEKD